MSNADDYPGRETYTTVYGETEKDDHAGPPHRRLSKTIGTLIAAALTLGNAGYVAEQQIAAKLKAAHDQGFQQGLTLGESQERSACNNNLGVQQDEVGLTLAQANKIIHHPATQAASPADMPPSLTHHFGSGKITLMSVLYNVVVASPGAQSAAEAAQQNSSEEHADGQLTDALQTYTYGGPMRFTDSQPEPTKAPVPTMPPIIVYFLTPVC